MQVDAVAPYERWYERFEAALKALKSKEQQQQSPLPTIYQWQQPPARAQHVQVQHLRPESCAQATNITHIRRGAMPVNASPAPHHRPIVAILLLRTTPGTALLQEVRRIHHMMHLPWPGTVALQVWTCPTLLSVNAGLSLPVCTTVIL